MTFAKASSANEAMSHWRADAVSFLVVLFSFLILLEDPLTTPFSTINRSTTTTSFSTINRSTTTLLTTTGKDTFGNNTDDNVYGLDWSWTTPWGGLISQRSSDIISSSSTTRGSVSERKGGSDNVYGLDWSWTTPWGGLISQRSSDISISSSTTRGSVSERKGWSRWRRFFSERRGGEEGRSSYGVSAARTRLPFSIDFCDFYMAALGFGEIPCLVINSTSGDHVYGDYLTSEVVLGKVVYVEAANSKGCFFVTPAGLDSSCGNQFYVSGQRIASRTFNSPVDKFVDRLILIPLSDVQLSNGIRLAINDSVTDYRPDRRCVIFWAIL